MYPNSIVKGFDIFKHQTVRLIIINNTESVDPFSFDKRMKGFNAGVVVRVSRVAVA